MRILQVLTYYRPHISGLAIYVERLSTALVRQGHRVTVLTGQIAPTWPRCERREGIDVVRVPVRGRIGKGVFMPSFAWHVARLGNSADIVHLHLPQFDAPVAAFIAHLLRKPVIITYHCDLQLPHGRFNHLANHVVGLAHRITAAAATAIVGYTIDYAVHSPFLARFIGRKLRLTPPPVSVAHCTETQVTQFRRRHDLDGVRVIGVVARLAAEKGIELLLQALPRILETIPNARVLHAGPSRHVVGEAAYNTQLTPLFNRYRTHYKLLGTLTDDELGAFYRNLDVLVLPSRNSTESFGLVQIEAMSCGVSVCAADLPGVRQPVLMTGMGTLFPPGDSQKLADAVVAMLQANAPRPTLAELVVESFRPEQIAAEYAKLYADTIVGRFTPDCDEPDAYRRLRNGSKRSNVVQTT
ncbi:MAG: glycosyltransferase family 4 protein [Anaerolineae bacterium]|nr:glycosyltransferase family 4 protein [Anaerolineae bacterium]